jgi:hypothetical protein
MDKNGRDRMTFRAFAHAFLIMAVTAPGLLLSGCGMKHDISAASAAVVEFHSRLNNQDYGTIYQQADPRFRDAIKADDFQSLLTAIRNKLGGVLDSKQQGYFVNYNTSGTQIRLTYATKFSGGDAQEEFVWSKSGATYQLLRYHINSNALITK